MKTWNVFCELETICKCHFPSHETIFFSEKYNPEESSHILTPEGQIKLLNPQKYLANYMASRNTIMGYVYFEHL
jgi:hypothetical protein